MSTTRARTTLRDLAQLDGVVLAFESGPDGTLKGFEANGDVPHEMAEKASEYCITVTRLFSTLSGGFTQASGIPWIPQHGWAYFGGEYMAAFGNRGGLGVFVETAKADFNRLFRLLM